MARVSIKGMAVLLGFALLSFICLLPRPGKLSTLLETRVTREEGRVVYECVDGRGHLTYATDWGYAREIDTIDADGHILSEAYFDELGRPVVMSGGFFRAERDYNEEGRDIRIRYYGLSGTQAAAGSGADEIRISYSEDGTTRTEMYYLAGEPVRTLAGFYGTKSIVSPDGTVENHYLDRNQETVNLPSGFGIFTRQRLPDGSALELYYDREGNPWPHPNGEYGCRVYYDENYRLSARVFLDEEGNPAPDQRGVLREQVEYVPAGEKTTYYGADGEPVDIGYGIYGVLCTNALQNVFLDRKGHRILRLDNLLQTLPGITVAGGLVLTVLVMLFCGKKPGAFIALYFAFILLMTLAFRKHMGSQMVLTPFWSYRKFFYSAVYRQEILFNWWLFVPIGAALAQAAHKKRIRFPVGRILLTCLALSLLVECLQYILGRGMFETDDLISNTLGGFVGWLASAGAGAGAEIHLDKA